MERMEKGKYSGMVRQDYLQHLESVRRGTEKDQCIQEAIEYFLNLDLAERRREAAAQRVRITHAAGSEPDYYMMLDIISMPDDLEKRLEASDVPVDTTKALNAAIRLWLEGRRV